MQGRWKGVISMECYKLPNHWSTKETMVEYADKGLIPYMTHQRQVLELPTSTILVCVYLIIYARTTNKYIIGLYVFDHLCYIELPTSTIICLCVFDHLCCTQV